jgi:hypothetical protein
VTVVSCEWGRRQTAAGCCFDCKRPLAKKSVRRCPYHLRYQAKKNREFRARMRAAGKCCNCGQDCGKCPVKGYCNSCAEKNRVNMREYMRKRRAKKRLEKQNATEQAGEAKTAGQEEAP